MSEGVRHLSSIAVALAVLLAREAPARAQAAHDPPADAGSTAAPASASSSPSDNGSDNAADFTDRLAIRPPPLPLREPPQAITLPPEESIDYVTPRYEPAGFPIIAGSSDTGFEAGGVGTLTRFGNDVRPYIWNMDLVLTASVKSGPGGGLEVVQQNYFWDWDVPGLFDGNVRVNPAVSYVRTINVGYYGIGNASSPDVPANATGDPGRYFQFVQQEARLRQLTRIKLKGALDVETVATYRYEAPEAYAGSKVAVDDANPPPGGLPFVGLQPLSLLTLGPGLVYDTRDNEFFPHRGTYDQVSIKFTEGFPFAGDVRYGEVSTFNAAYIPVGGPFVLGLRFVTNFQFGNVPFYDLFTGGPFVSINMVGGENGVRGVPLGRYSGLIKAVGNVELRELFAQFKLLGQNFHLGSDTFFDTGRVWTDYTFTSPYDGSGIGLKWGLGAGAYLQWGQAAVFRIEVAYSPDAEAENPNLPLGIYVSDGTMF